MSDNNKKRSQAAASGSAGRPFYQLPPHYKPCGTIIKETRLQLQSAHSQHQREESQQPPRSPLPVLLQDGGDASAPRVIRTRPVNTKRPFTPFHGEALLWGTSGRKRPPSAITLARLILDEGGEEIGIGGSESGESRPESSSPLLPGPLEPMTVTRSQLEALHLKNVGENGGPAEPSDGKLFEEVIQALEEPTADLLPILRKFAAQMGHQRGSASPSTKIQLKPKLLKLLFRVVERNQNDGDLLFWSSYILLHLGVSGNNLTTVYKMIFKASKCKDYLETIRETDYIEIFLDSFRGLRPLQQPEALIYGYGILKFLLYKSRVEEENREGEGDTWQGEAGEGEGVGLLEQRLLDLNLIEIMATHLRLLNKEMATKEIVPETVLNSVFQLTSILRVLIGVPSAIDRAIASGLMHEVCESLATTAVLSDVDVVTNAVRVLSITSEMEPAIEIISSALEPASIVQLVQLWHNQEQVLVRLMYCLGNLVVGSGDGDGGAQFGRKLFTEPLFYQLMIQVICFYLEGPAGESGAGDDGVLIKSLRFVANWSLDPEIGAVLSGDEKLTDVLTTILQTHAQAEANTNGEECESPELLICTVATLNNLSYYQENEPDKRLVEALLPYLGWDDLELRTEVVKVLGNFTRAVSARSVCSEYIGFLLLSLEERDANELLYATLGLLINVVADFECKNEFIRKQGLHYLIDLLSDEDELPPSARVRLCLMIAQLVWNLIVLAAASGSGASGSHFHQEEINELCGALEKKMDEHAHDHAEINADSESALGAEVEDDRHDFLALASKLCDELRQRRRREPAD